MRVLLIAASALLLSVPPAMAQSGGSGSSGCNAAPATPPSKGPGAGTDPGSSGSTGFSGAGLGGAYTGTSPNGPTASSPSAQPATAKGLDPISSPPKVADAGKC